MALYYTLDEMVGQIVVELNHIDNYLQMLNAVTTREQQALGRGDDVSGGTGLEADLESLLTDADKVLEDIVTNLISLDFTKYAFEVRVGSPGLHHHTEIAVTGTPGTTFFTASKDAGDITMNAYDNGAGGALFAIADIVEIINSGNIFMDGFFTITSAAMVFGNTYAEAALVDVADTIDQAYNVIVRLRER